MEIKIEHNQIKQGEPTSLGIMLEITAPTAPVREADLVRKAKSIVFVVDRSGSMGGGRLEMVKNTILDTLARLNPGDYLSVVTFDDDAVVEVPLQQIAELNLMQVRDKIGSLVTGGSTNLELGYRFGLAEASKSPAGVEATVMVLSDGHANSGVIVPEALGQLAAAATEHYVTTTTMGIGSGYDENILDAMADSGNGNHIAAVELAEAVAGLQAEIDDLLMKTMTDVKIDIEFGEVFSDGKSKVRKVRHLRKFRATERGAQAELGDLSSGEEKNVVFELNFLANLTFLGKTQGFTVRWSYVDATVNQLVEGAKSFEVEIQDPNDWEEPARNEDIVAELKTIRLQDVRDRAVRLYNEGREAEADDLLREAGLELQRFMDSSTDMSPRARSRMYREYAEFTSYSSMPDMNEKSKRIREGRSRSKNDKSNFRDDI
jgi:Ca-activated chloride channel family protein